MAKHYVIADIHGMYDIYEQVNEMLEPDDIVYFLGDAGDRGYDCFKCIRAIYDNPQWIYLKGNHEDMMAKAIYQMIRGDELNGLISPDKLSHSDTDYYSMWMWNGGYITQEEWMTDGSADTTWATRLEHLPLQANYTNEKGITFHMSHAGFTCGHKEQLWGDELIWNRSHWNTKWDEEKYPNDICIHGHTPIPSMIKRLQLDEEIQTYVTGQPEARVYCNGHKINIDNAVFHTGATVLYDLDEMKAIPLFDRVFQKEDEEGDF